MNDPSQKRVILITGNGKGKTSSAFGMVLRAVGHKMRVSVIQFVKQSADTGEARTLRSLPSVTHHICGKGFVQPTTLRPERELHRAAAEAGLAVACEKLADPQTDMVVLDEICAAVALGLLPEQTVLESLTAATDGKIIILTGRDAPQSLIDAADTVSHIQAVKHAYDTGLPAQPGVEF